MGWQVQAYLKPAVAGEGDQFGASIGLSTLGDTLVVGAPGEGSTATGVDGDPDDNAASGAGAAYVFKRHGLQWMQQAYLKASNTDGGDELGLAVAIAGDGNTVAIGAPNEASNGPDQTNNAAPSAGAVYVFATDGETWAQQAYLKTASPASLDAFGGALAISANGATLAIGAHNESAYVFARSGVAWSQQALVQAATPVRWATVSAPRSRSRGSARCSPSARRKRVATARRICSRGRRGCPQRGSTRRPPAILLGAAVAISADGAVVAVSALDDDAVAMDSGAIHVFGAPAWTEAALVKAPVPMSGMAYGNCPQPLELRRGPRGRRPTREQRRARSRYGRCVLLSGRVTDLAAGRTNERCACGWPGSRHAGTRRHRRRCPTPAAPTTRTAPR